MNFFKRAKNGITLFLIQLKQEWLALQRKQIIDVIGDSHSLLFQHERFRIHHIGPATAFQLNSNLSTTQSKGKVLDILNKISKYKNPIVILVFGEIDCRIHIFKKHKESNIPLGVLISRTVDSYIQFVIYIHKNFPNVKFMVFNILPSGEQGNFYKYNYYPSRRIRLKITKRINYLLRIKLEKEDIIFIDIYEKLVDKQENRILKYIFDDIHYNSKIVSIILENIQLDYR